MTDSPAMSDPVSRQPRLSLQVVIPLCVAGFSGLLNVVVLGPFVAVVANDLDVTVPRVGMTATAALATTAVSGLLIGWLADIAGFRKVLVAGLGLLAASGLLAAGSVSYLMFTGARVVGAVGFAAANGLPNAIVATRYQGPARQRSLGYISAASVLAGLVGPPVLTFAGDLTSWRVAFALVASFGLIAAISVRLAVPAPATSETPTPSIRDGIATYASLLNDRALRLVFLATLLQMASLIGTMTYVGAFLTDVSGLSVRYVGFAFAAQSLGGLLASFIAGRLSERRTRAGYVTSMIVLAIAVFGIYAFPVPVVITFLLMLLAGGSQVTAWVLLIGLLARITPAAHGSTMVFNGSVLGVGGAAGSAVGGGIMSLTGYAGLGVAFSLLALLSAVAISFVFRSLDPAPD